ncbi:MAG: hypothetical protein QM811_20175 [Pirellulales bacterium]
MAFAGGLMLHGPAENLIAQSPIAATSKPTITPAERREATAHCAIALEGVSLCGRKSDAVGRQDPCGDEIEVGSQQRSGAARRTGR